MAEGSNKYNGFPQGPSKLIKPQDLVRAYLKLTASAASVICPNGTTTHAKIVVHEDDERHHSSLQQLDYQVIGPQAG